ncbi:hypothetical protein [Hymenobacter glacieicola]|uniref:DUF481 domain-containing protein n=1 Tax=Hymenobacter glacieicola TaxID=1562124 RepID=A0ABQ1X240_9BACT|nr:hypothetical protein [Hymenobacter glacieicola]GGG52260.1 hypothetical protein GCM10011378_30590 [Hymenobacter glacieicola]
MSCSVYAPLQPGAPLVHKQGEAEVAASAYLTGRLEASAAYSPAKHVIVRAAGGLRSDGRDSAYFRIRQLEVGAGTYQYIDEQWLIGGMLGYGQGRSSRRYRDDFESVFRNSVPTNEYAAHFHKLFGEAYVANDAGWTTFGGACRVSRVQFATLTNRGNPIPLHHMVRVEPMLFMRFGGQGRVPWLQGQVATSVSWSPNSRAANTSTAIRDTREGRLFTSFGLVIYPHLFKE